LHKTLGEIRAMPNSEYVGWQGYYMWKWEKQGLFEHKEG